VPLIEDFLTQILGAMSQNLWFVQAGDNLEIRLMGEDMLTCPDSSDHG
jgi:hypothetical protein